MRAFVCPMCKKYVPLRRQQFAERLELRRLDGKERPFVTTVAYLCRECLSERIAALRETEQVADQGVLNV